MTEQHVQEINRTTELNPKQLTKTENIPNFGKEN
jgi:hypothetical protein